MENRVNDSTESSNGVVLELYGIDKRWVRDKHGRWIDERELPSPTPDVKQSIEVNEVVENYSSKKRWQFWKR